MNRSYVMPALPTTAEPSPPLPVLSRWSRLPIRTQLLIAIAMVCAIAAVVASALAVFRANDRARIEVNATLRVAERLVSETVRGLPTGSSPDEVLSHVSQQLRYFRHVRTSFTDVAGHTSLILPPVGIDEDDARAPLWFEHLVYGGDDNRQVPVELAGRYVGTFKISGEPGDEIAEVWSDLSEVSMVAAIVVSLMFAMLYFVLGRILDPLNTLSSGLQELEQGRYATRVAPPGVKELEPIAEHFNGLAGALDAARAENRQLMGHLITIQEDERRQIANELHDEAGPCLFGVTANAGSILTMVKEADPALKEKVTERVAAILDSAERLKALNRSRLKTLRPVAIGRVSLEELLSDLLAEFEKRYPGVSFFLAIEPIAPRYGEAIELTIYRCLQQGLTNALQHGGAKNIDASLMLQTIATSDAIDSLVLTMTDDGIGISEQTPFGFGLTSMRERVIAVNGTCTITRANPRGTTIEISIPVFDTAMHEPNGILATENLT